VGQAVGQAIAQLGAGLLHGGPVGLAAGHAIGRVVAPLTVWRTLRADRALGRPRDLDELGNAARRHRRFPFVTLWSSLINAGSAELPVWILAAAFAPSVVGWFALTTRVLQAPMALVGQAVGQVYYARAARESSESLRAQTLTAARRLLALATGPLALVLVAGPTLFGLVFGDAWLPAGRYAQWLAPWLLLVFVSSPISTLVFVLDRQRAELVFQVALLVARVASLGLGVVTRDPEIGIAAFGITNAVMRAGYLGWLLHIVGVDLTAFLAIVARRVLVVGALAVPAVIGTLMLEGVPALVAIGVSGVALAVDALRAAQASEGAP
jgi:lipopolysaccharide exporter